MENVMERNPVGWFEIYVNDLDRATKFYETVLGVQLQELPSPMPHLKMMAFPMSMEAGGLPFTVQDGGNERRSKQHDCLLSCQDCGVEADRIEKAGGKIQMPKTSIGQYGSIALGLIRRAIFWIAQSTS